jgi:hypothetical protein
MRVAATAVDPEADIGAMIRRAQATSTISNSIARGIPVVLTVATSPELSSNRV